LVSQLQSEQEHDRVASNFFRNHFTLTLRESFKCLNGHKTDDDFIYKVLKLNQATSIKHTIKAYFKQAEAIRVCSTCQITINGMQEIKIRKLPTYLVIGCDGSQSVKVNLKLNVR
jgi:hypothetical protein